MSGPFPPQGGINRTLETGSFFLRVRTYSLIFSFPCPFRYMTDSTHHPLIVNPIHKKPGVMDPVHQRPRNRHESNRFVTHPGVFARNVTQRAYKPRR